MTTSTASPGDPIADQADTCVPKGIVAGTVLRAARLSAGVTETVLACEAGLPEELIRAWEDGSLAFASASETEAKQLKDALYGACAQDQLVADLDAAAWCDVLIAAISDQEDLSYILNDPIAGEKAFRELLAWAVGGQVPARYRRYFEPWPLLAS